MTAYFCITVRFLQPLCHARNEAGHPEWPPSPLRLFQALVAAAAARWNERLCLQYSVHALRWLERQANSPIVVAPVGKPASSKYRLYVPDNVCDKVGTSWARGQAADIAAYRVEKDVQPTKIEGDAVHYLFPMPANDLEFPEHKETLIESARSISSLGWGIDMVAADATVLSEEQAAKLPGEHWRPSEGATATGLRVPIVGTLDDLMRRHDAFLRRLLFDIQGDEFYNPVAPLAAYRVVAYQRATEPPPHKTAAFALYRVDASGYRAFDTTRQTAVVAGMLRNATKRSAQAAGWPREQIAAFVLGHREAVGEPHRPAGPNRFCYIPLPTIESRGEGHAAVVGSVRRALVVVMAGNHRDATIWATRALSGMELTDERSGDAKAVLSHIPLRDTMVQRYLREASVWSTVTPLILPGYNDPDHYRRRLKRGTTADVQKRLLGHLEARTECLIRKAILHAGFTSELAQYADIDWRNVGFWPGCELATRYTVPAKLRRFPRLHVRIKWRNSQCKPVSISGPVCIGGGRFVGLGLFAPE